MSILSYTEPQWLKLYYVLKLDNETNYIHKGDTSLAINFLETDIS